MKTYTETKRGVSIIVDNNANHIVALGITRRNPNPNAPVVSISIANPNELCCDNNYNGNYAEIELNAEALRVLITNLQRIYDARSGASYPASPH